MRVKTEKRRKAIMDAAAHLFREQGFNGTSMAAIAARLGGSKATLYSYFPSKEELFVAVTMAAVEVTGQTVLKLLDQDVRDIRETLTTFGRAYLDLVLSPEVVTISKIGMSLGNPDGLGANLYENGPAKGWRGITASLARLQEQGMLNVPNAQTAALHFKALLEAGLVEPTLYGAPPILSTEQAVQEAVDVFLLKYGT